MFILYILLAIVILLFMIMVHEFGHYTAGKLLKFKIEEFSIGFGKPIFSRTMKSGEVFSLRWIPLGGFCAFKGEDEDGKDEPDSFNNYAPWKRLIVLFCGAFFNFLSGIIFSLILLLSVGSGVSRIDEIVSTQDNLGGLQKGDIVLEVNGEDLSFFNGGLSGLISNIEANQDIFLKVDRNGEVLDITVHKYIEYQLDENGVIVNDDNGNPIVTGAKLGVMTNYAKLGFGQALVRCVPFTFEMAWECLKVLGQLFTGKIGLESVGGPLTTIETMATATQTNAKNLLLLFPLIAVNLAVFNLLPIPALDGARMLFVLIEWIFRKPVPREIEGKIHTVGLFVLFAFVIIIDFLHIFIF